MPELDTDKTNSLAGGWTILEERGAAGELHALSAEALNDRPVARTVRFSHPDAPALVLGSHQPDDMWDLSALEAAGVGLARRRSGGSAVLVGPGRVLWMDLILPVGDPLWDDDVGRAAWWVGELWSVAIPGSQVWKGPMRPNEWSPAVCFAGLGPGEVTMGGRKMVGICQRRTGRGALFQTAALLEWRPDDYISLLARPFADPDVLAGSAAGTDVAEEQLKTSLVGRLMP